MLSHTHYTWCVCCCCDCCCCFRRCHLCRSLPLLTSRQANSIVAHHLPACCQQSDMALCSSSLPLRRTVEPVGTDLSASWADPDCESKPSVYAAIARRWAACAFQWLPVSPRTTITYWSFDISVRWYIMIFLQPTVPARHGFLRPELLHITVGYIDVQEYAAHLAIKNQVRMLEAELADVIQHEWPSHILLLRQEGRSWNFNLDDRTRHLATRCSVMVTSCFANFECRVQLREPHATWC